MSKFIMALLRILALGTLVAVTGHATAQQAYPSRTIRIIVAFPPGGSVDPLARLIGQKLSESWGQQVIIDNRPGGNSIIGTEAGAKAKPDGYTLLMASGTLLINANIYPNLPYDAIAKIVKAANIKAEN